MRYEAVTAMLLNEFLKEHRTVQELKSAVTHSSNQLWPSRKQVARSSRRKLKRLLQP